MRFSLKEIAFEKLFKLILLVFIAYFLFLLTVIVFKGGTDVGRYQFRNDGRLVIDTKTGRVMTLKITKP